MEDSKILVGPSQLRMFYDSVMCSPCPEQGELSPWSCREQEVSAHLLPVLLPFTTSQGELWICLLEGKDDLGQAISSVLAAHFFFSQQQMKGAGCCALGRQQ